ncbi:putative progesterone binding protein [Syncephalis pseudoplumigaleata]|uniref:Putative progesterone binding protein n=1 Tax=Syncephalis pseudoplumigaleata TaxID=1712513 RepID=A0A4V1J2D2_9FUNG|nr:putative progesterone binding protein [Syncephalis pseudoplumigaleata]|eukprot:RKP28149.1 putative progesterone binding protein [Syncephalis pseudoplumigaleata]
MMPPASKEEPVQLAPPLDTPYTAAELAKHDGSDPSLPTYVAVKGVIFDVSTSDMYKPGSKYGQLFAGKDASRALAMSSLKAEDCTPNLEGLSESELQTLDQWYERFSKKYNIVGKLVN